MSQSVTVPWRAGRGPGESPAYSLGGIPAHAGPYSIPVAEIVLLADVSEFQQDITDAVYVRDFSQAIIFRAKYGTVTDKAWYGGARRSGLHAAGARFIGIYQYITAREDVIAQADALCDLLGQLQPGEKVIGDLEEGSGGQKPRWLAWAQRVAQRLGDYPWNYSGENFAAAHGLQPVDWIAAYQVTEPAPPHLLWQFTDVFTVPGIPGKTDCSVYHGTIDQLAAQAYQKPVPVPPGQENNMPGGVVAGPIASYPVSFERGSVTKILFYAPSPVTLTVHVAHSGSLFNAGQLTVSPRAEYDIVNTADVDAIVLTDVSGPVGWHTE